MLLQLPDEILCLISTQLEHQQDRLHLASSCRRLYIALHRTIFVKFLYTIVRNPKLASAVHVLFLGFWTTKATYENHGYPSAVNFDRDIRERLVQEAASDSSRQEKWIKDLECGITDAWLALIIPRLNNLREISLPWSDCAEYIPGMFIDAAKSGTPVFPHLEEAWTMPCYMVFTSETELMLPFLTQPMADLDTILQGVENIPNQRRRVHGTYKSSNLRRLYEALLFHKTTLQVIYVLMSFTNLEVLHISPYTIVEMDDNDMPTQSLVDRLPTSLEFLSIPYFNEDWLDWVLDECELLLDLNVCPKLKTKYLY
ncbi:uncharacterized protein N7496_001406 [Penicillium cataractarum]|uniref:F-box domain-containing protein n=1 Tax=Penicillium cataractarum TaxID=2100454 RepID=A0A9W9VVZ8_9EURO|nr:uncharacterized protein N7496_001406 [Penicillium cataractarum]KAJ5390338.1 hypothetical protein N7496_001406 [Penicillium cataractarum]